MTGIILLAAGSSSRMGKPKQNLLYQGKTLLQHAVFTAISSVCEPIVVVLGSNAELMTDDIKNDAVNIINNNNWTEGMASSIRAGLIEITRLHDDLKGVIIMLSDQPFVDATLISQLLDEAEKTKKGIIASFYNNTLGAPALFKNTYFPDLLSLTGHEGAKKLFDKYKDDIGLVAFPGGATDIDTPSDYASLTTE